MIYKVKKLFFRGKKLLPGLKDRLSFAEYPVSIVIRFGDSVDLPTDSGILPSCRPGDLIGLPGWFRFPRRNGRP